MTVTSGVSPVSVRCRAHRLRSVIDRVFPFAEAKHAYRYFGDRTHIGKVIISGD
jgi:NADPH:quinone reductase-like Zn-dependent oxidoreductase